jgi:hypothetical protein
MVWGRRRTQFTTDPFMPLPEPEPSILLRHLPLELTIIPGDIGYAVIIQGVHERDIDGL